jgi:hypothetical protein
MNNGYLVLLHEDLGPRLDPLLHELIGGGHRLRIEDQDDQGAAPFTVGAGLRLFGDAGILNTRTVRAVVERSIVDADDVYRIDLVGLEYLALMSWAVVLQATQSFRALGGTLTIHARGSTRRLLVRATVVECDRTNLELV